MLRVALLADRVGPEVLDLLRGLRRYEFHLVTLDDDGRSARIGLPGNVLSWTDVPRRLPAPAGVGAHRRWAPGGRRGTADDWAVPGAMAGLGPGAGLGLATGTGLDPDPDADAPAGDRPPRARWAARNGHWLLRETAARHLCRGYLRADRRLLATGLRMLAGLPVPAPRPGHRDDPVTAGLRSLTASPAARHHPGQEQVTADLPMPGGLPGPAPRPGLELVAAGLRMLAGLPDPTAGPSNPGPGPVTAAGLPDPATGPAHSGHGPVTAGLRKLAGLAGTGSAAGHDRNTAGRWRADGLPAASPAHSGHGLVTAGLRMLAGLPGHGHGPLSTHDRAVPFRPVVGPHPLGGVLLDALGAESLPTGHAAVLHDALRPLALRLPPVHVVHAIGPRAGLAALAHSWRRGTPYILSGVESDGPVAGLCRDRAHRTVERRLVLDATDYPPPRAEPAEPVVLEVSGGPPRGAAHYAGATVVVATGGVSYPLVEAMMSGLPVVAVEAEGVADLVGDAGLVVAPADVRGARDRLLAEPALRGQLGLRARRRALDRHALGRWLAAHEEHYRAAAGA
ncbi:glycosyltransferase [Longispora sp. K20-0274]|uniref:glycosyltransferase n=1 Tax=Longispora sp. K20-0274 TaxID=3088255 RepID=UPI00399A9562